MVKWRKQREKGLDDPLHRWLTWFDERSPPELVAEVANMDNAIKAANDKFGFVTQQDFDVWDYNRRREKAQWDMVSSRNNARREGHREGHREGQREGEKNKALEIARNALTEGATPEFVQKITGLDIETIKSLN